MKHYACLIGSYANPAEESILRYAIDFEKKEFTKLQGGAGLLNPSYLYVDEKRKLLYCVEEDSPSGSLSVLNQGDFSLVTRVSTVRAHPCHVSQDETGEFLCVANYCDAQEGGSLALYRLDESGMPKLASVTYHTGSGPNQRRQLTSHPHFSWFQGDLVFACDLGTDYVYCYRLNREAGALVDVGLHVKMPGGCGPRHLYVSQDKQWLYVVGEIDGFIYVLHWEEGRLVLRQSIDSLPAGTTQEARDANRTAAIKATEDERYLFVTNRGDDSVTAFAIGKDHLLTVLDIHSSGSVEPRELTLFGDHMLLGHQEGSCITALTFDRASQTLKALDMRLDLPVKPVCIVKC